MKTEIKNLSTTSLSELTRCFNEAFSDYFVKFDATESYLKNRWHLGRVKYDLSFGCFIDGTLRGFIIHGIDWRDGIWTAHNCATGLEPNYRGKGNLSKIYEVALESLKKQNVTQSTLEVISKNVKAIRAYEKNGFKVDPTLLLCFSGQPQINMATPKSISVKKREKPDFQFYETCQDYQPSWEMGQSAISLSQPSLEFYEIKLEDIKIGYLVFSPSTELILQFAIHPSYRNKGYGKLLFQHLLKKYKKIRVNNVPATATASIAFLNKIGMKNVIDQYEMRRKI